MMLNPTAPATASPSATGSAHECDYCGRAVYQGNAVERVERTGDGPQVVTLCLECARGTD